MLCNAPGRVFKMSLIRITTGNGADDFHYCSTVSGTVFVNTAVDRQQARNRAAKRRNHFDGELASGLMPSGGPHFSNGFSGAYED